MFRVIVPCCALFSVLAFASSALGQASVQIPEIAVSADAPASTAPALIKERYQLPNTTATVTADQINTTINAVDAADTIKYLPSLLVRKRNYGDNQEVLATRTTGINASARTLVYVDDVLITGLIGNNNTSATPRWE